MKLMWKWLLGLCFGAFIAWSILSADTFVAVIRDGEADTGDQNVSLVLVNGVFAEYTVTALCGLDTAALMVDFGPQPILGEQAPIQYAFNDDRRRTENWPWDPENQVLLKFDKELLKRLIHADKLTIRFVDQVEVFEFSNAANKVKEFSDACERVLSE